MLFGRIHGLRPHKNNFHFFSGDTLTDEFMFPLSVCTCTADNYAWVVFDGILLSAGLCIAY